LSLGPEIVAKSPVRSETSFEGRPCVEHVSNGLRFGTVGKTAKSPAGVRLSRLLTDEAYVRVHARTGV